MVYCFIPWFGVRHTFRNRCFRSQRRQRLHASWISIGFCLFDPQFNPGGLSEVSFMPAHHWLQNTVQYRSKVSWRSVASLESRFSILARMEVVAYCCITLWCLRKKKPNFSQGLLKRLKDVLKIFGISLTNNIDRLKPESKKQCSVMFNLIMSQWIVKLLRFNIVQDKNWVFYKRAWSSVTYRNVSSVKSVRNS